MLNSQLAEADTAAVIGSQLLLQSDLRGVIEQPAWYFSSATPGRLAAAGLDALMLTQGWRRYDLPSVLRGSVAEPQIPVEKGPAIIGSVRTWWRNKPVADARVSVMLPATQEVGIGETDKNGIFTVDGIDWPQDSPIIVQAKNKKGGFENNVHLDTLLLPATGKPAVQPQLLAVGEASSADYDYRIEHPSGMMQVQLADVVVSRVKPRVSTDIAELLAQKSIDVDELKSKEALTSYEELLRHIPGLFIWENNMYSRREWVQFIVNSSRIWSPGVDKRNYLSDFEAAYPIDLVKRIDFIPSSMSYAFHGGGGPLVNVVLKTASDMPKDKNWNLHQFRMLGYQPAAEYFTPDYSSADFDAATEAARPLLYWLPSQTVSADKPLHLPLPEGVRPVLVVEGVTDSGVIISR